MLEAAVAAGIAAAGGEALLGGVLPTPGAPLLIGRYGLDLGVVISASHNPYRDNGIKFFGGDGFKLSDDDRGRDRGAARRRRRRRRATIGRVRRLHGALEDYLRALHERFADLDLSGRRVLLDCANGATYRAAPEIFRRLGAEVDRARRRPGRAQHQRRLRLHPRRRPRRARCAKGGHDAGFAFDGDGDRVLAVDRDGAVVDGDELIALAALHLRATDRLPGNGVAVTVMTNYGFHTAMRDARRRGRDHAGRRPLRARGAARARLGARRRAVRPHHRHGLRPLGRRDRRRAADARGARRRRPRRPPRDGEAAADGSSTSAWPIAPRSRPRRPRAARRSSARPRRSRAAAACSCARAAPSRSCA